MREILMFLLGTFAVTALAGALSHSSLSSSVRTSLATVTLAVIALPILSALPNFEELQIPESSVTEGDFDGYVEVGASAFCEGIALAIREEFLLSDGEVKVECIGFDFAKMRAEEIKISLCGDGVFADFRLVKRYVEDNFTDGGRCYIDELFE